MPIEHKSNENVHRMNKGMPDKYKDRPSPTMMSIVLLHLPSAYSLLPTSHFSSYTGLLGQGNALALARESMCTATNQGVGLFKVHTTHNTAMV